MYCPNCGTQLHDGAKFCKKCGASADGDDTALCKAGDYASAVSLAKAMNR